MNDYNNYLENLILEVTSQINPKINGILFLELVKYRIIDRLKDDNFIISDEIEKANSKTIFLKERDIELNFRLIFCKSAIVNLNTLLENNILLICIKEDLNININDCKSNKIFNYQSVPMTGTVLTKGSTYSLNCRKKTVFLEINLNEKKLDIENLEQNTI